MLFTLQLCLAAKALVCFADCKQTTGIIRSNSGDCRLMIPVVCRFAIQPRQEPGSDEELASHLAFSSAMGCFTHSMQAAFSQGLARGAQEVMLPGRYWFGRGDLPCLHVTPPGTIHLHFEDAGTVSFICENTACQRLAPLGGSAGKPEVRSDVLCC